MGTIVIDAENLSKAYRLGTINHGMLYKDLQSWWARFRGKDDPNAKIDPHGGRREIDTSGHFWALKDVSFRIEEGDVLGIIGKNGAGKSTLLKVLSKVTAPTKGTVKIKGRVASLLEVGTGFHPELTGRENVFLNGAILGMTRKEISKKFDEIIDFAEIEEFIDTPVKRYSSGMYVRLAFSVAAHLEPEILIVDEVLAVGDASFQKKCLGKMENVSKNQGRTVLFVSHNMGAVGRLCGKGLLLKDGELIHSGDIFNVIEYYSEMGTDSGTDISYGVDNEKKMQVRRIRLVDDKNRNCHETNIEKSFGVIIEYDAHVKIPAAHVALMIDKMDGTPVWHSTDIDAKGGHYQPIKPGRYRAMIHFPGNVLNAGAYQLRVGLAKFGGEIYDYKEPFFFNIQDTGTVHSIGVSGRQRPGVVVIIPKWKTVKI